MVEDCAKAAKYAAQSSVAVARKHFQQLNLSESTAHYFRKKNLHEVSKRAEQEIQQRCVDKKLHWKKNWIPRSSDASSVYVTVGLLSALLLSR